MSSTTASSPVPAPLVRTVLGDIPFDRMGITDGHNHVWIDAVPGADPAAPVLDQYDMIRKELRLYREAGGGSLLDCQPGGCGRDGNRLRQLAGEAGVNIVACTGFHRRKYYPPEAPLFAMDAGRVASLLVDELLVSLAECDLAEGVRAGFIKIALEATWAETPQAALEGAAIAARQTGALVEIHTEKGALAERAVLYFEGQQVSPQQLVLCHMDKRPDIALHAALARTGVLLEYDTFYRPKYNPAANLWPLICSMAEAGLSDNAVLATDMAEGSLYRTIGNGPGLASLPGEIRRQLEELGIPKRSIQRMLGGNITRRLAWLS